MKSARLKISYDAGGTIPALRKLCRDNGAHDFPGEEGKPGVYSCRVCGTVMTVRESMAE